MFDYFQKIHIFRRFLLSYVLILIIPLIASFIVYQISVNRIVDNATTSSEKLLKDMISAVDQKNTEIDRFIYQLHYNQEVKQLIHRNALDENLIPYDLYQVRDSIGHYAYTNTLFSRFYIYFNHIDTIITPETTYVRPKDFFERHTYNGMSYEEWNENINQKYYSSYYHPATNVTIKRNYDTEEEVVITYVKSLPLTSGHSSEANVVIMINENEFTSLLNPILTQYNGSVFVYNQSGDILFSNTATNSVATQHESMESNLDENDEFMHIELTSEQNGWTYVASISKDRLMEDVNHIKTINTVAAFITIFVGLCIAFAFAYRNSIPLSRLLGIVQLSEPKRIKNPYEFLHSNVQEIITKNTDLKNQIQQQQPILQDSVLRAVVMGEWTSVKDEKLLLEQADVHVKGEQGYVGIIQIIHHVNEPDKETLAEMNVARVMIQNEVKRIFNDNVYLLNYDVNQIIFLLTYPDDLVINEHKMEKDLTVLIKRLINQYNIHVNIGISQQFQEMKDIPKAYDEAKSSLPFVLTMDQPATLFTFSNKTETQLTAYYYPIELELRLINSVMNGDVLAVKEIFSKLHLENVEKRKLTQQNGAQIITLLHETIVRILSKNTGINNIMMDDIQEKLEKMKGKNTIYSKEIDHIQWIMIDIAKRIEKQKVAGDEKVINKIKAYIKENFDNPDLTLYNISEAINFPEKRIPNLFKDLIGMNISEYIEEVRMNHAKWKLTQTTDTIEDIAASSGYNSGHSFRRAFKRNTGLSPSEYRKTIKVI